MLIHSIIYYELNTSIVSDAMYDNNCNQLVKGIKKHPEDFKKTKYYKQFYDFDGSTGYHLYSRLNQEEKFRLRGAAQYLIDKFGKK